MLHPFMGIQEWDKVGLSVAESAARLRHIAYLDRQAMRIAAGWMVACPTYEIKGMLARTAWIDATHHDQLRNRCRQLRMSPAAFDKCPDPGLQTLMDHTRDSAGTLLLATALFEVIKPAQIGAIRQYALAAQPIVDEPTLHLLRHQLIDREDEMAWGREAIAFLSEKASPDERAEAERWRTYLTRLLASAGGADGTSVKPPVPDPGETPPTVPFRMPDRSARDERFKTAIVKFEEIDFEDNDAGRFLMMMYSRYFEMSPAEGVALMLYESVSRPWAFYLDTARHLWDEVRHSWFGEAALRKHGYDIYEAPNWIGFYHISKNLFSPDEAYVHLTVSIEQAAMKYPPGKREEYEFARDVAKDSLMAVFQDFDWADEVVHAGFGKKWAVDALFDGNPERAAEAGAETWEKRNAYMRQAAGKPGEPPSPFAGNY